VSLFVRIAFFVLLQSIRPAPIRKQCTFFVYKTSPSLLQTTPASREATRPVRYSTRIPIKVCSLLQHSPPVSTLSLPLNITDGANSMQTYSAPTKRASGRFSGHRLSWPRFLSRLLSRQMPQIRPRPLPLTSFQIYHSLTILSSTNI
jgi:hypothetical protein